MSLAIKMDESSFSSVIGHKVVPSFPISNITLYAWHTSELRGQNHRDIKH